MKTPSRRALALSAIALLIVAGFAWVVAAQGPLAPVLVTVAKAGEAALPRSVFGIGTVEARRTYNIGPVAPGRLARVLVDHGDAVKAGQLLAEMDPVDLDERVAAGRAGTARAGQLIQAAEATLTEATSRARLAQSSAERYADLRRKNFVSQEAVDAKNHESAAAQAAAAAARANLAAARDDARRVGADLAGTGKARAQLRLTSPADGVVFARLAEPGSTLAGGQAALQLIDPESLWVRARIDQGRSAGLVAGLPVQIVLRSRPGQPLPGRIARIDLVGDAVTEERIVDIAFDRTPPGLAIGELAQVDIRLAPLERTLAIPAAAVKRIGKSDGAWLVGDGRIEFRKLSTGAAGSDGLVQVTAGLAAGDAVVVHSSRSLTPDLRVKVVDSLLRNSP